MRYIKKIPPWKEELNALKQKIAIQTSRGLPAMPVLFHQKIMLSDGSTSMAFSSLPANCMKFEIDCRNNKFWNPTIKKSAIEDLVSKSERVEIYKEKFQGFY